MSTNTQNPAGKAGVFRVIEGGLSKGDAPEPAVKAGQLPGKIEAERLRRAILKLPVPKVGLTVEQALDEVCSKLDESDLGETQRGSYLCNALEDLGVRFQLVNPDLGLAREGFLVLVWPQRLMAHHPELAGLHPMAHQYLQLG